MSDMQTCPVIGHHGGGADPIPFGQPAAVSINAAACAARRARGAATIDALRGLLDKGLTIAVAAERLGITKSHAKALKGRAGLAAVDGRTMRERRTTDYHASLAERNAQIEALAKEGMLTPAIVEATGISKHVVYRALQAGRACGRIPPSRQPAKVRAPLKARLNMDTNKWSPPEAVSARQKAIAHAARTKPLGKVNNAEADALVAAFLAKRAPTQCPPMAVLPINNNGGF